jgi:hypothetical protein
MSSAPDSVPVTEDSVDPRYHDPYVDVDEWREDPEPHRYVHGGFAGTDARFSLYFPPSETYEGRFFQNTYPLIVTEDMAPFPIAFEVATGNLGFTLATGAYYVQTNLGGADRTTEPDPAIAAYRVNAAAAKYSRLIAAERFGDHRPYGYLFGGSGGSYQVMGAAENTRGVWDGFLPYVLGTPNAVPSVFTVRMHALRVLRRHNKFPAVMDAINPGGSGDPYADLDEEERAALREATLLGYPLRSWWNHDTLNSGYLGGVVAIVKALDPTYVADFWTRPGYLGADPSSSIHEARVRFDTEVTKVIDGPEPELALASRPDQDCADADVVILSGAVAGQILTIGPVSQVPIRLTPTADRDTLSKLAPGDRVRIDNSWALALQTYQRHQVPATPDLYGWNQFRHAGGQPVYPQRDLLTGEIAAVNTVGSLLTGRIHGKVLVLEALMDIDALPWQADWYRSTVEAAGGPAFEDNFAIWFMDHAQHDNPQTRAAHAHTVSYEGALQQGLRDLAAWVEHGTRPAQTRYRVVDTQVQVPASAAERGGIQPVVELAANGSLRAEVGAGEPVVFEAAIEVPAGAGRVVAAEWCFEGRGDYADQAHIEVPVERLRLSATHSYAKPGTYFPVLRATSQRAGDTTTPYGRIQNLARARVVVT